LIVGSTCSILCWRDGLLRKKAGAFVLSSRNLGKFLGIMRIAAIRSYEHFQATGLHVTIEEMEEWATSLGTSIPQTLPQCHK